MAPVPNPKLVKKAEKLKKEVSVLKQDIRSLQNILIQVDAAKSNEEDQEELKKIEQDLDDMND